MDTNDKISRSSLHVEVTDRLREMIYDRSLPPGERIDELGLSSRLGTSRTPLREALKVLAHEGLVRLVPGRGAFVIELATHDIEMLFPVLGLLQSRCAGDAVRHAQPADIEQLDTYLLQIEQAVTQQAVTDYHRAVDRFHERLQGMAANPWLSRSITDLRRFLQMVRALMPPPENRLRQSMAEYRTLMKAIHRRDADAAEQLVYLQAIAQQRAWRAFQAQQPQPTDSPDSQVSAGPAVRAADTATPAQTPAEARPTTGAANGHAASHPGAPASPSGNPAPRASHHPPAHPATPQASPRNTAMSPRTEAASLDA